MGKLIIPKTYIEKIDAPLIFLAGPIKSAPNWQAEAIDILFSLNQDIIVASPKKEFGDEILQYVMQGNENYFPRQRAWERYYLDIASKAGSILFWLPGEERHDCKKVYGAMTRIELGQWMTKYKNEKSIRLCFGSDGNFPELSVIKYDLSLDAPDKKIIDNLEDTCKEALMLAK